MKTLTSSAPATYHEHASDDDLLNWAAGLSDPPSLPTDQVQDAIESCSYCRRRALKLKKTFDRDFESFYKQVVLTAPCHV